MSLSKYILAITFTFSLALAAYSVITADIEGALVDKRLDPGGIVVGASCIIGGVACIIRACTRDAAVYN
ncbi:hypothetical protein KGF54_003626 [Candida jiufengensis]|uniref:uncharacterized protein n=1 Tax=Candida jiufengensis TaxID=497108 RepID=UPI002224372A|nr:uncharacterized protein KGF54_003626 [Candida jiufengensis]KAI5952759.1 hypothetical protein KGF54_003626 [Candida jiufengensis]